MEKIFITGVSGVLGGHLSQQAQSRWETHGSFFTNSNVPARVDLVKLDVADPFGIRKVLFEIDPAVVIHSAVMQVDECERYPELARAVIVDSSREFAEWCEKKRRRMVYISSDLVFDGEHAPYSETDEPRPAMAYGKYKLAAENAVLRACPQACVARLPLMYGFPVAGGKSFFISMLRRLRAGERVRVFHDQYRTPGLVDNMAQAVLELAASDIAGVIHLAGAQRCSREQFARCVCQLAGLDAALLEPISMYELPLAASRPRDVSMKAEQARHLLQTPLLGYEEGLRKIVKTL